MFKKLFPSVKGLWGALHFRFSLSDRGNNIRGSSSF